MGLQEIMPIFFLLLLLISYSTYGRPRPSHHPSYGRPPEYPTFEGHGQEYYSVNNYDGWFYEMDPHHDLSDPESEFTSHLHETFRQMQDSIHMYAPALHVGKINRGHFPKPELLQPRHRVMGYNSDFNQGDDSAFGYTPSFPNPRCVEGWQGCLQRRFRRCSGGSGSMWAFCPGWNCFLGPGLSIRGFTQELLRNFTG